MEHAYEAGEAEDHRDTGSVSDSGHEFRQHDRHPSEVRVITDVKRIEDGWSIEVEDARGIRLTYWIADTRSGCVPHVGDTAHFYGGTFGKPLQGLEINGCRVFYNDRHAAD